MPWDEKKFKDFEEKRVNQLETLGSKLRENTAWADLSAKNIERAAYDFTNYWHGLISRDNPVSQLLPAEKLTQFIAEKLLTPDFSNRMNNISSLTEDQKQQLYLELRFIQDALRWVLNVASNCSVVLDLRVNSHPETIRANAHLSKILDDVESLMKRLDNLQITNKLGDISKLSQKTTASGSSPNLTMKSSGSTATVTTVTSSDNNKSVKRGGSQPDNEKRFVFNRGHVPPVKPDPTSKTQQIKMETSQTKASGSSPNLTQNTSVSTATERSESTTAIIPPVVSTNVDTDNVATMSTSSSDATLERQITMETAPTVLKKDSASSTNLTKNTSASTDTVPIASNTTIISGQNNPVNIDTPNNTTTVIIPTGSSSTPTITTTNAITPTNDNKPPAPPSDVPTPTSNNKITSDKLPASEAISAKIGTAIQNYNQQTQKTYGFGSLQFSYRRSHFEERRNEQKRALEFAASLKGPYAQIEQMLVLKAVYESLQKETMFGEKWRMTGKKSYLKEQVENMFKDLGYPNVAEFGMHNVDIDLAKACKELKDQYINDHKDGNGFTDEEGKPTKGTNDMMTYKDKSSLPAIIGGGNLYGRFAKFNNGQQDLENSERRELLSKIEDAAQRSGREDLIKVDKKIKRH